MTLTDISDLLPLMPRAVDFVWHRGRVATQYDETGTELPKAGPAFRAALGRERKG